MKYTVFSISIIFGLILTFSPFAHAQTISELQQRIAERNADIADLEKEIAQYQNQINQTAQEAKTLKDLIATLNTTRKKLDADIALTQNKITATSLTIDQLGKEIINYRNDISSNKETIGVALKTMHRSEQTPLLTAFLGSTDTIAVWTDIKRLTDVQEEIKQHIEILEGLKKDLEVKKLQSEGKKVDLATYQSTLADQKKVIVYNTEQKNKVLSETQNKEAVYQQQLAEKKALRDAVQKEINEYESQLRLAVDPTSYPSARAGVLSWPLSKITITQYFGNTAFATANAAIYGGQGHNAIDLAAAIGTPIKSAFTGVVQGFGDTDLTCPGASYGRWIVVKHTNGLSTLYAHLSVISVSTGQTVQTGETIGYSGNTGYSTGPHLHFGVYASQGLQLVNRPSAACGGKIYYMPVADYKAYLNPLSYLPTV